MKWILLVITNALRSQAKSGVRLGGGGGGGSRGEAVLQNAN